MNNKTYKNSLYRAVLFLLLFSGNAIAQSTFTVTTNSDPVDPANPPAGTLRWAINEANASSDLSTINFNIQGGSAPYTIQLETNLPDITTRVILDATTQPEYIGTEPLIVINAINLGYLYNGVFALLSGSSSSTIRGFTIHSFEGNGIRITSDYNLIADNVLHSSIYRSTNNTRGVILIEGNSNSVYRNIIGTDGNNTTGLGCPYTAGILIWKGSFNASNNRIGNAQSADGNIITNTEHPKVRIIEGVQNKISGNRLYNDNAFTLGNSEGIKMESGGNNDYPAPYDMLISQSNYVTGKAQPGDRIEIFGSATTNGANVFLTNTYTDGSGKWLAHIPDLAHPYVTATATQNIEAPNTSQLAVATPATCNISAAADPTVVCFGDTSVITLGGAESYDITGGDRFSQYGVISSNQIYIIPYQTTTYTFVGITASGCADDTQVTITVNPLPDVSLAEFSPVLVSGPAFALTGGEPAGGTYSGTGVTNGYFDPAAAGIGSHEIKYTYTDANGCTSSMIRPLKVTGPSKFCWAKQSNNTYSYGNSITTDDSGNSYVTGVFNGTANFGAFSLTSGGSSDIYIVKYDDNGVVKWAKRAGGVSYDYGSGISYDKTGNIYVTGSYKETATFDAISLTSLSASDVFLAKYDTAGTLQWVKSFGDIHDPQNDQGQAVVADANNVYLTGYYQNVISFENIMLFGNGRQVFITKFDPSGNVIWAQSSLKNDDYSPMPYGISMNGSGNAYVTGYFGGNSLKFGDKAIKKQDSSQDIFLAKFNPLGVCEWLRSAGGSTNSDIGYSVSADASPDDMGNVYITGAFQGTAYFDDISITSPGTQNTAFIAKYNSAGNIQWVRQAGGEYYTEGYSVTTDQSGNAYVGGYFYGDPSFDNFDLNSFDANGDLFVVKYNPSGIVEWAEQTLSVEYWDYSYAIGLSVGPNKDIYLTGGFTGTTDFGPHTLSETQTESATFVAKLCVGPPPTCQVSVTPNTAYVCLGDSITLTATGAGNYTWSPATGLSSTTGACVKASPTTTTTYTVTGVTEQNCTSTVTVPVTVLRPPVATITALTTCDTTTVNFLGSGNSYNGPLSYNWQFGDGHISNLQNPSHTYSEPGNFLTILTVNDGYCTYVCSVYVKVGTPKAYFNVNNVCLGGPLAVSNVTEGATSYAWSFGDGNTSSAQTPLHFYTSAGTYTVRLITVSDNCPDTTTRIVTVSTPVSNASFTINATPACINAPVTFNNTSSIDATQFLWTFGDGNQVSTEDATHTYTAAPPAPGSYKVVLKASNGGCFKEAVKYVTVKAPPIVTITGPTTVCDGSTINLAATITNIKAPSSQYSYQWSFNDGVNPAVVIAGNMGGNLANLGVNASSTYTVIVTDGCGQKDTASHTVSVLNLPQVSVTLNNGTTCAGLNNGSATVSPIVTGNVILWSSGETTATANALHAGVNQVTVSNGSCSKVLSINVPYAGASVAVASTPSGCNMGSTLGTATAVVSNGTASSYTWTNAAGTVLGSSSTLNGLATGSYNLTVKDNNNCVHLSPFQVAPAILSVTVSNTQTCAGTSADVTAAASVTGPLAFNGSLTWNVMANNTVGAQLATGTTATLPAGKYRVTATDSYYQCTSYTDFTIAPAPPMVVSVTTQNPKCNGGNDGSAIASVSGGTGTYTYEWKKGTTIVSTGQGAENLMHGTYTVTITDDLGCSASQTAVIAEPEPFTVTHSFNAGMPCQMTATAVNGNPGFIFKWIRTYDEAGNNIPDNTENITRTQESEAIGPGLPMGYYIVEATDTNGCIAYSNDSVSMGNRPTRTFTLRYAWVRPAEIDEPGEEPEDTEITEIVEEVKGDMAKQLARCLDIKEASANQAFESACLDKNNFKDEVNIVYNLPYHHYTLYYYDRAGNLTKTVPPEGVKPLNLNEIKDIIAYRYDDSSATPAVIPAKFLPDHNFKTTYNYNSLAQLTEQHTPDGDSTKFRYNDIAQLRYSQNAKQKANQDYSYTKYDYLGRIKEVGEGDLPANTLLSALDVNDTDYPSSGRQVTITTYTTPGAVDYNGKQQRFLTNRVSHTFTDKDGDLSTRGDRAETFYSYDPHGNVEWLVQDIPGFTKNYLAYDYDLISGNVLKVRFNENRIDRFFHRYSYDEDNRIKIAETSRNGILWDKDAAYEYYAHGPLKRTMIGEDRIQGIDHTYTIEGWLKGINTPHLTASSDPGNDGGTSGYLKDVFGMSLGYYSGDFNRSHNGSTSIFNTTNNYAGADKALYNGNISSWSTNTDLTYVTGGPGAFAYGNRIKGEVFTYDQLNRITRSDFMSFCSGSVQTTSDYATRYRYDANGNLLKLSRIGQENEPVCANGNGSGNSAPGNKMDDFSYGYASGSNRLTTLVDSALENYSGKRGDIYGTHQYTYDAIGNLTGETYQERKPGSNTELINVSSTISWNVYGKIEQVTIVKDPESGSDPTTTTILKFGYDATGNRISKEVTDPSGTAITYYVRDASGNVMGTYERKDRASTGSEPAGQVADYYLREQPIYGSSRIGQVINQGTDYKVGTATVNAGNTVEFIAQGIQQTSELKSWISPSVKKYELATDVNTCDCKIRKAGFTSQNTYDTPSTVAEFMGDAGNGVSVAEDIYGNLKFYTVTAKSYLGHSNVCLIYDKNGDLMKNSSGLLADAEAKPVVMKRPGTNNEYCLFTVKQGTPYMHIINMSQAGYGTSEAMGEVTDKNIALDNTENYGLHVTALEDAVTGINYMYTTRYKEPATAADAGTTEIVAFEFAEGVTNPTPVVMTSISGKDATGNGEVQLSPDGKTLAYFSQKKHVGGFAHRETEVSIFIINPNNRKAIMPGLTQTVADNGAGTIGKAGMDFAQSGSLYLSQDGIYMQSYGTGLLSEKNIFEYNLSTNDPLAGRSLAGTLMAEGIQYGDLRRGKDGKIYLAGKGNDTYLTVLDGTAATTASLDANAGYGLTGHLPTQTFKVGSTEAAAPIVRRVGDKMYELTDHLGNVRATVSDRRGADITGGTLANYVVVEGATDYYAFGMQIPRRSFINTDYKYGFSGQENDNEISGEGNHLDFKYRAYDPRLGRFWSVDPLASKFAWNSSYAYAENRVIEGIDFEGLEFMRKIDYNIATGQFNVQIDVKVKVVADEEIKAQTQDMFGVDEKYGDYLEAAQNQYSSTVGGVNDPVRNIQYSGNLIYDENATISLGLGVAQKTEGNLTIAGISTPGYAGASVATMNNTTGVFSMNPPEEFGVDAVHELFHQGGVEHPTETCNPPDARLQHVGKINYVTTPFTANNIIFNIMLYGLYNVNGQNVNSARGGDVNGTQATPGQMNVINTNVGEGQVNGEAMYDCLDQ